MSEGAADPVFVVDEDDPGRRVLRRFLRLHVGVCHDDHEIVDLKKQCRRAVQADHSGVRRAFDNVGLDSVSIADVHNLNTLVREDSRSLEQC